MTNCTASPQAALMELMKLVELADFVELKLTKLMELAKLTEESPCPLGQAPFIY